MKIERPNPSEYDAYFSRYIDKIGDVDILGLLAQQVEGTVAELSKRSDLQAMHRYAPGKWSIKEIVGHIADTERIFVYRAVCFARGEQKRLPGFDENAYVAATRFDDRRLADLLAELKAVRAASLAFFSGLTADELTRRGTASEWEYSVRAVPFILAGHEKHHVGVIREKYLTGL
jgi:uncharacterized damage-inducible protein DinB